jgi:predicted AlkP superfamily pyrophosphatase or phosphodiesterase
MRRALLTIALAAALVAVPRAQSPSGPPKLVVLIVVDQMRADYVTRFRGEWSGGLRRMVTRGAWFSNAAYPYMLTFTCAGHATISTGALPHRHGIMQNTWFDRQAGKIVRCSEDDRPKSVLYGGTGGEGDSAARLLVPTFAEVMRSERKSRVVTLSLKARSAIMLAGQAADAVTWRNESLDGWQTSTAYGGPVAAVQAFVDANPVEADYGKSWVRSLPRARYRYPDVLPGEMPPGGWTLVFPHVLTSRTGKPDAEFYTQWERSPYGDEYLGRMAAALASSFELGRRDTTDVLAVSFSSPDLVGHAFGPLSEEVQDMYARLDRTIGVLFDRLDRLVGRDQYVVALSADHGVSGVPEQLKLDGKDAGKLNIRALGDAAEHAAIEALGPGKYVASGNYNDVYFLPGVYDKLKANSSALNAVVTELSKQPSVARVFRREELADPAAPTSSDIALRAAALSYVADRNGDLIVAMKPGWMFTGLATTHGSATEDDQRVPIIFYGRGIKPGEYRDAATPADVTPTLAALFGITMPQAEGQPLRAALAGAASTSTRP